MWLRSRRKRWSCFVPGFLLTVFGCMLAASLAKVAQAPAVGVGIGCAFALGAVVFALAEVRIAREHGSQLVVRTLFGRSELDAATVVVSVITVSAGRAGLRHDLVAKDASGARAVLGTAWTLRGAERACAKLGEALESLAPNRERERLRQELAEERRAEQAQRDAAMAQVKSYYASPKHKRTLLLIAAGLVLYVVGMAVYVLSTGGTL